MRAIWSFLCRESLAAKLDAPGPSRLAGRAELLASPRRPGHSAEAVEGVAGGPSGMREAASWRLRRSRLPWASRRRARVNGYEPLAAAKATSKRSWA